MSEQTALEGLLVLDLTRALAGPFAAFVLAGLGAEVIKIEQPGSGALERTNVPYIGRNGASLRPQDADDISFSFLNTGRNKRSVTLNLKHPEGRSVFADLVRQADVVLENFSAGTADRMGVGYSFCASVNPHIVYCGLSGFGAGDHSGRKAMDTVAQAASGVMYLSGIEEDPPVPCGLPMGDLISPLWSVIGILSALRHRDRTGEGQMVDVAMVGSVASFVAAEPTGLLNALGVRTRNGRTIRRLSPFGVYPASDGYVAICASRDEWAAFLFRAMGRADMADDPEFNHRSARVQNGEELDARIAAWSETRTVDSILALLAPSGMPLQRVNEPGEAIADPDLLARADTMRLTHPEHGATADVIGSGIPIGLSRTPVRLDRAPPALGADNRAILGERLGYDAERLRVLAEQGAI